MATTHVNITPSPALSSTSTTELPNTFAREGLVAGLLGATTIAVWFLLVDTVSGHPLYTPTVLGLALFQGGADLAAMESVAIDLGMVFLFTLVHGLVFIILGSVVSYLLGVAEHHRHVGFGILLLFIVFEVGFIAVSLGFAEPVLRALAWPAVLVGNLLAAAAMAGYFWRHHPRLVIEP
jgi:hypothetical protein